MIDINNVMSTYNGKAGRCCCGCAGKRSYASKYVEEAGKRRGYAIGAEEVSDISIRNTVRKLNENLGKTDEQGEPLVEVDEGLAYFTTETKVYVAYFRKPNVGAPTPDVVVEQPEIGS